jgi:hypothetical protein
LIYFLADSKLFGTECKASDLKCQLGDSILVWDKNIIHYFLAKLSRKNLTM